MKTVPVTIMEMEHHFLYLPLYFARAQSFFGQIPAEYETSIVQAPGGTDADAYQRLSRGEAQMAVCDPCAIIYASQQGFVPVVLAGLIVRGAFWAVDTKSPEVTELDELAQFQHIIAFFPGSTSHGIASRILRSAKGTPPIIESVRPLQEFTKLEDLVREKRSAVALTPDVLRIERSMEANKEWISVKLALADTVEYAHMLTTAIIARPEFVANHPDFISGFLKALQRSLILVAAEDPDVLAYAGESFNQPIPLIRRALKRATNAQVWGASIAISEDLWLKAVHAHYDSLGTAFDASAKREAQGIFAESFKPRVERAQRAARELLEENKAAQRQAGWRSPVLVAMGLLLGMCSLLALQGHEVAQLVLALGIVLLPIIGDFPGKRHLIGWDALLLGMFSFVWILHFVMDRASEETYVGAAVTLAVLFVEANFRIIRKSRSRK